MSELSTHPLFVFSLIQITKKKSSLFLIIQKKRKKKVLPFIVDSNFQHKPESVCVYGEKNSPNGNDTFLS